ncbi:glycosyltransferase family 4 protein [Salipaludibacillus agaradhaerens]|nr:glycosyltransferase family 4 protein [Salipaludibacillus agaradhaerens]MCR6111339.1 glycosyltransferase family 4 protein [Bacillus sp. A301a_S52]MCR6119320.1 glycosyltransferase family 4 protein [Salipaludibacillus agaradhaerens]
MEIANQMYTISKGLQHHAISSKTLNYFHNYLNYSSEFEIDWRSFRTTEKLKLYLLNHLIPENDLFHFHFATSLYRDNYDLTLIKNLNKPVIMHHWGSDVRQLSKALEINPYAKVKIATPSSIDKHLRFISNHISHCIVPDDELRRYVEDYYEHVHIIPSMIDLEAYTFNPLQKSEKPLIVHAPTHPEIKGTSYIVKAIEQLKPHYSFKFELVEKVSHIEAKKMYEKADIIIDQLHIGSYGLFSIEGMAMGKPVICYISDYMLEKYPSELPIIPATPDNIQDKLEELLKNKDVLPEIGLRSRKYAQKYHDYKKNSANIIDIYKSII